MHSDRSGHWLDRRLQELENATAGPEAESLLRRSAIEGGPLIRERVIALAARHLEPETLGGWVACGEDATLRNAGIEALQHQGTYALDYLTRLCRGDDDEMTMFAVQILSGIPAPPAVPLLESLLDHPEPNVAIAAIEAIGAQQSASSVDRLIEIAEVDLWKANAAVEALARISDPRAEPFLLGKLGDEWVGVASIRALGLLGGAESMVPLVERLLRGTERESEAAVDALADWSARHPDRDPELASLLERRSADCAGLEPGLARRLASGDAVAALGAAAVALLAGRDGLYPAILKRFAVVEEAERVHGLIDRMYGRIEVALTGLIRHEDADVRVAALTLAAPGTLPLASIVRAFEDEERRVRNAACRAVAGIDEVEAVQWLVECLRAPHVFDRDAVIDALSRVRQERLSPLGRCLDDENDELKVAALTVIGRVGAAVAFDGRVRGLVDSGNLHVAREALRTLGCLPGVDLDRDVLPRLQALDPAIRREAVHILAEREHRAAIEPLIELLDFEDTARYDVILALGRLRAELAAGPLERLFPWARPHEQAAIITALTEIASNGLIDFLDAQVERAEPALKRVAAEGLVRLAGPSQLSRLLSMSIDEDWSIRGFAAWGLGRLALEDGREALTALARDVEPVVAETATEALNRLGDAG